MGPVDDSKSYTIQALAENLGYKQARSVERLLREICCPVFSMGNRKLISGKQFREALERSSKCSTISRHGS
jgi:hypothetical protein